MTEDEELYNAVSRAYEATQMEMNLDSDTPVDKDNNWAADMAQMHQKFGVRDWVSKVEEDRELLKTFLAFRLGMIYEELGETQKAALVDKDPEEVVDGLIDICVFAIGTLDIFGVDANKAWDRVYKANMVKSPGQKAERANSFGLPDMIKPEGWRAPDHSNNHGKLPKILNDD